MQCRSLCAAAVLIASCLAGGGCATVGVAGQAPILRAKDRVAPALVHIRPVKEVFASGERREVATIGSGFIISADGYVITNEHVAGESKFVRCVLSDREEVEAEVVGVDPFTDVALLKLQTDAPLPHVRLGNSDDIEPGQMVLALGSPHGLARSVSMGIISVTDRYLEDAGEMVSPFNNWIQTDAAINPGNSGGPLVNLAGEVIGVNARRLSGAENVGFAIPINVAKEVVEEIRANGRVRRAWVGAEVQEMLARTENPEVRGVIISDVDPVSPARDGGIMPGDVLVAINGTPVHARFEEDLPAVRKRIASLPIDTPAQFTIRRGEEEQTLTITTVERSAMKGQEVEFAGWGFTASELTPQLARAAQLPGRGGVLISGIQPGGIADTARLRRGDIILTIDSQPVAALEEFRQRYEALQEAQQPLVLMQVKRGALTRFVLVKPQGGGAPAAEDPFAVED